jgi:DNA-directed RNA polymerase subunit RPC12/RpoP
MEKGEHSGAADIFERLARVTADRGMLRHAPNLYLQAARSRLMAGATKPGSDLINQGLAIFAKAKRWPALARAGQRVVIELQNFGHPEMADDILMWLESTLPEPLERYKQTRCLTVNLPLKCPYCGGALRPDDVEMLDQVTGECPYCGSAIRGN